VTVRHRVCNVDELPIGRARRVEVGERWVSIWNIDGRLVAIDDRCPHQGASLARGYVLDGCIVCPWHGSRFDPETGREIVLERLSTTIHDVVIERGEIIVLIDDV
jgi:nitrite reductase (NADH) small subunit/3-phenylpropionate/trans-cinnamate dioxygenase ferredoxin subunit